MDEDENTWGQLVSITDNTSEPFSLIESKFSIGRVKSCNLSISGNKLVSSCHCYIEKDDTEKVWLYDSSTNGTLLNLTQKLSKGECRELHHGDEFYIVYKKNDETENIGYMYQDMKELRKEDSDESEDNETQEYEETMAATLELDGLNEVIERSPILSSGKRKHSESDHEEDERKIKQPCQKESLVNATSVIGLGSTRKESFEATKSAKKNHPEEDVKDEKNKSNASNLQEKENSVKTTKPSEDSETCGDKNTGICAEDVPKTDVRSSSKAEPSASDQDDVIAETLVCIICQEIFHDCVSLQPCMHSFCAGCYSDWMQKSDLCPSCRGKVERINKNHLVNSLIEAYMKEHPEKKRPDEDIKELEAKNKITRDMLYPKRNDEDSSDYSDSEDPDGDTGTGTDTGRGTGLFGGFRQFIGRLPTRPLVGLLPPPPVFTPPTLFGLGTPVFGGQPAKTTCRQCPDYKEPDVPIITAPVVPVAPAVGVINDEKPGPSGVTTNDVKTEEKGQDEGAGSDEPGPSGLNINLQKKDEKIMPDPPKFVCGAGQNHVLCTCCLHPMPDRRVVAFNDPDIPTQACKICYRVYCHNYWGCRKVDCNGCLAKFKDMNFGKKCLITLILDNTHESDILKNYLDTKNISVKDMLDHCMMKLERGEFSCADQSRFTITPQTALCYPCALRNFKDLAYNYRQNIPKGELPAAVTSRPDCYWGKNCRTQRNKPHHATHFSHVCDQTRTMI